MYDEKHKTNMTLAYNVQTPMAVLQSTRLDISQWRKMYTDMLSATGSSSFSIQKTELHGEKINLETKASS